MAINGLMTRRSFIVKGEMLRLIRDVLRGAEGPLSSREITLSILAVKEFDTGDAKRVTQVTSRVYKKLLRECEFGRAQSRGKYPKVFLLANRLQ